MSTSSGCRGPESVAARATRAQESRCNHHAMKLLARGDISPSAVRLSPSAVPELAFEIPARFGVRSDTKCHGCVGSVRLVPRWQKGNPERTRGRRVAARLAEMPFHYRSQCGRDAGAMLAYARVAGCAHLPQQSWTALRLPRWSGLERYPFEFPPVRTSHPDSRGREERANMQAVHADGPEKARQCGGGGREKRSAANCG